MKILFFAPHSAVWIHAFPEALAAEALAQQGHEIVYVGCGGSLGSYCISMSALGMPFEAPLADKQKVCGKCRGNERILRERFGFVGPNLVDIIDAEDRRVAEQFAAGVTPQNCLDLQVDGIEVGRIASYELLVQAKKKEIEFTDAEWLRYQASLINTIMVLKAVQRLLDQARPDRVIVYNALYAVHRVVSRAAQLRGIPQYFLHAGDNLSNRLQTLILARDQAFAYYEHLRERWPAHRDHPVGPRRLRAATDHFLEVGRGRSAWAYSAAPRKDIDIRSIFDIAPGQKILCATMSSEDERFSAEVVGALPLDCKAVFARQVDWIKALIDYVSTRKHWSLIVRVHPREFPNKRESVMSAHAQMLRQVLAELPDNVKVNWPTDAVSLYDLAGVADVFLNAWSSAGKEMAWLGLPVVLYSSELTLYPADLNYVGVDREHYFSQLEQALQDGWSAERIRRTYRWCAIEYHAAAVGIADSYARSERYSFISRALAKVLRSIAPYREQKADCRRRAPRLAAAPAMERILHDQLGSAVELPDSMAPVSHAEETEHLKREVGRLAAGLYPGDGGHNTLVGKLRQFAQSG